MWIPLWQYRFLVLLWNLGCSREVKKLAPFVIQVVNVICLKNAWSFRYTKCFRDCLPLTLRYESSGVVCLVSVCCSYRLFHVRSSMIWCSLGYLWFLSAHCGLVLQLGAYPTKSIVLLSTFIVVLDPLGALARKVHEELRRQAAAIRIQKSIRCYRARKSYLTVRSSAIKVQTGLRGMQARNVFRYKKET